MAEPGIAPPRPGQSLRAPLERNLTPSLRRGQATQTQRQETARSVLQPPSIASSRPPAPTAPTPVAGPAGSGPAPSPRLAPGGTLPQPPAPQTAAPAQSPSAAPAPPQPATAPQAGAGIDELRSMVQAARSIGDFALSKQYEEQIRMAESGTAQPAPPEPAGMGAAPMQAPGHRPTQIQARTFMMNKYNRNMTPQESEWLANATDDQIRQMLEREGAFAQ